MPRPFLYIRYYISFMICCLTVFNSSLTGSLHELNIITCIPDHRNSYPINAPSIEDICSKICNGTAGEINTFVKPKTASNLTIRLLEGVVPVNDTIIYIFVSGWAGWPSNAPYRRKGNALYYVYLYQQAGIIPGVAVCYDHPNNTLRTATFGQKTDQDNLAYVIECVKANNPSASLVLVGISYGATTILNFLTHQSAQKLQHIKAAVLESPFINLESIIMYRWPRYLYYLGKPLISFLAHCLPAYTPNAPTVLDVDKMPRIPLCIGALKNDSVISYQDIEKIALHLRTINQAPVYFFTSTHPEKHSYLVNDPQFAYAVNNFYKDNGLFNTQKPHLKR